MKKKVIIVFLLVAILNMTFCITGVAFADTDSTFVNEYVLEFANQFVKKIDGGEIKDIIPIYDIYDDVTSCCFTIYVGNEPYMYLILDNYYREGISPIIEMGFGEYNFDKDQKIVNVNYIDYGVKKNNVIECNNEKFSVSNLRANNSRSAIQSYSLKPADEGYYDSLNISDEIKKLALLSEHYFFEPYQQEDLMSYTLRDYGICGSTLAMNVLRFYYDTKAYFCDEFDFNDDAYKVAFKELVSYVNDPETPYNLPYLTDIKTALTQYVKNNTSYKVNITKYLINSWTFVYNDINNEKLVSYTYETLGSDGNKSGHGVLAVGAVEYKSAGRFIYVADSWSNQLRWLNFDYHSGIQCMSIKIYE